MNAPILLLFTLEFEVPYAETMQAAISTLARLSPPSPFSCCYWVWRLSSEPQPLTSQFIYLSFSLPFLYGLHYWLQDIIREIYHFPSHKHLCNYIPEMSFFVQTKLAFGRQIIGANVSFWSNCKKGNGNAEIEITNIVIWTK